MSRFISLGLSDQAHAQHLNILAASLAVGLVLLNFGYSRQQIISGSMVPTIQIGQKVWADHIPALFGKTPEREQIVLFAADETYSPDAEWTHRIVALPGDTVKIWDGQVLVNGKATQHPDTTDPDTPPFVVPAGMYYQKGDNPDAWNGLVSASEVRALIVSAR